MDNNWTVEKLESKCSLWKKDIIKVTGDWNNYHEYWDVNTSEILTKLIQVAGRFCDRYASDLFILWETIKDVLKDYNYTNGKFLFGFKSDGVDHTIILDIF